ncbi:MAG: helix-turn-helix domain-containing protein [Magnetococcales bacterium]|nr:helix-turn-helix domain-containing protein [Magnetococcales bacterium]MBF0321579.1 helix-turn-helix domain-containing protein [Magnetococcales bacterium]
MDTLQKRLIWAREKAGMNKSELARRIGVKPQSVIQWESGRTGIAKRNIMSVAEILQVSPEWLQFGRTVLETTMKNLAPGPATLTRVPLISWKQAGVWIDIVDNLHTPGEVDRWIDTTRKVGSASFALRVVGDSMEPKVPEGAIIVVDPEKDPINKSYVVACLDHEDEATFKQLVMDGGTKFLKPINPRYPVLNLEGRVVRVCGVVRQVLIDLD